ncbi:hypothetical protein DFH11DRAFT_1602095, partial [Phellopilus nigrolimitatus]
MFPGFLLRVLRVEGASAAGGEMGERGQETNEGDGSGRQVFMGSENYVRNALSEAQQDASVAGISLFWTDVFH